MYVHDLPSNQQQITHVWRPLTTYENLTDEEIKASVSREQEINYLTTVKQECNDPPMTDTLFETWIPEVKGELIQFADPETIDEFLNTQ